VNTVQLIGNLTRDPELRLTNGGTAVSPSPSPSTGASATATTRSRSTSTW
jgi:single-stranded DNA-binding protein